MINELTLHQKNHASLKELELNNTLITNSSELSNTFDVHFSTTGPNLATEVSPVTVDSSYANYIVVKGQQVLFQSN